MPFACLSTTRVSLLLLPGAHEGPGLRGEVVWAVRVGWGGSQFRCDVRDGRCAAIGFVRETDDIVGGYLTAIC